MELTNDDVFDFIFREEYAKIPFIFRFSRKRVKIAGSILGALVIGMCVTSAMFKGMNGITALIVAAVLTLLVAGWMHLASLYEQKALKKASQFTFKYSVAERERWHSRTDLLKQKSFE